MVFLNSDHRFLTTIQLSIIKIFSPLSFSGSMQRWTDMDSDVGMRFSGTLDSDTDMNRVMRSGTRSDMHIPDNLATEFGPGRLYDRAKRKWTTQQDSTDRTVRIGSRLWKLLLPRSGPSYGNLSWSWTQNLDLSFGIFSYFLRCFVSRICLLIIKNEECLNSRINKAIMMRITSFNGKDIINPEVTIIQKRDVFIL